MNERLGIDVGGVITDRADDKSDTSFLSDNYLNTAACDGAFAAIERLVGSLGNENVFIVSKCGENVERKTRSWLSHHRFFELTGMHSANMHFCRQRQDKAPICRNLEITHFIDDRADVLRFMRTIVPNRYLFGPQIHAVAEDALIPVRDWDEVLERFVVSDFVDGAVGVQR